VSRRKRFHRVCSYRACKMAVSGARARLLCCAFVTADVRSLQYLSARVVAYSADLRPRLCLKSDCCVSEIIGSEKRAVTGDRHCGSHSKCERFGCRLFGQVARMRLDVHAQVEPLPILWDSDCSLSAVLCCAVLMLLWFIAAFLVVQTPNLEPWTQPDVKLRSHIIRLSCHHVCRHRRLSFTGVGAILPFARTPISTADRTRYWGSQRAMGYGLRLTNAFSSPLHPLRIVPEGWHAGHARSP
jgi:hypothetical protein